MGLILDTSVLIDAERKKLDVRRTLAVVLERTSQERLSISAITLIELAHGVARSRDVVLRRASQQSLDDVRAELPVYALTDKIAVRTGLFDGELKARGLAVGLADLIIAIAALHHGDGVMTGNPRHFPMVPGLEVVEF